MMKSLLLWFFLAVLFSVGVVGDVSVTGHAITCGNDYLDCDTFEDGVANTTIWDVGSGWSESNGRMCAGSGAGISGTLFAKRRLLNSSDGAWTLEVGLNVNESPGVAPYLKYDEDNSFGGVPSGHILISTIGVSNWYFLGIGWDGNKRADVNYTLRLYVNESQHYLNELYENKSDIQLNASGTNSEFGNELGLQNTVDASNGELCIEYVVSWLGGFGDAPYLSVPPVAVGVAWEGYIPLNNSVMSYLEPIFFNHSGDVALNCTLFRNDSTYSYNESYPDNVSSLYRFEEGGGVTAVDSLGVLNGSINGATHTNSKGSNGTGSYALDFDSNDYVSLGDNYEFGRSDAFSFGAWVNTTGNTMTFLSKYLVSTSDGWIMHFGSAGEVLFKVYDNAGKAIETRTSGSFNDGSWHYVVGTYNGSSQYSGLNLYVDGVLVSQTRSGTTLTGSIENNVDFQINCRDGTTVCMVGLIDEVAIFDKELGVGEIQNFYDNGLKNVSEFYGQFFVSIENKSGVVGNSKQNFSDYVLSNGGYELFFECNNTYNSSSKFVLVNGSVPVIVFDRLKNLFGDFVLGDGEVYEYIGDYWNFSVNISFADSFNVSLLDVNGDTVYSSVSSSSFSLLDPFADFEGKNPYNLSVFGDNTFGSSHSSILFTINDSVLPFCNQTYLLSRNVTNNTFFVWNVSCVDELFFSFNMSCVGSNNFSFYEENINSTTYNFVNRTYVFEDVLCRYDYCDAHTKKFINPFSVRKDLNRSAFQFDVLELRSSKKVRDISWEKEKDRYSFCFVLEKSEDYLDFFIPDGCHFLGSRYAGHLVCPGQRIWIDFESDEGFPVSVFDDKVYVSGLKGKRKVCFESIGKFNCVSGSQSLFAFQEPSFFRFERFECDTSSTGNAIVLIGILLVLVIIILSTFWVKIPLFSILSGFFFLFIAWQFAACMQFLDVMLFVFGVFSIIYGFVLLGK